MFVNTEHSVVLAFRRCFNQPVAVLVVINWVSIEETVYTCIRISFVIVYRFNPLQYFSGTVCDRAVIVDRKSYKNFLAVRVVCAVEFPLIGLSFGFRRHPLIILCLLDLEYECRISPFTLSALADMLKESDISRSHLIRKSDFLLDGVGTGGEVNSLFFAGVVVEM